MPQVTKHDIVLRWNAIEGAISYQIEQTHTLSDNTSVVYSDSFALATLHNFFKINHIICCFVNFIPVDIATAKCVEVECH